MTTCRPSSWTASGAICAGADAAALVLPVVKSQSTTRVVPVGFGSPSAKLTAALLAARLTATPLMPSKKFALLGSGAVFGFEAKPSTDAGASTSHFSVAASVTCSALVQSTCTVRGFSLAESSSAGVASGAGFLLFGFVWNGLSFLLSKGLSLDDFMASATNF